MSNYQTDFLNALSITSESLSGLMRDIREPDFQDRLKLQEESAMRLAQQQQDFTKETMGIQQEYTLVQMDESQKDALERMQTQGTIQLTNEKDIMKFRQTLDREDAEFYDEFRRVSAMKDKDAEYEYLNKNYKKHIKLQQQVNDFGLRLGYKKQKGGIISNFVFDVTKGTVALPGVGTQRLGQKLQANQYTFETGLQLGRQSAFDDYALNRQEVEEAIYSASGVSPEFAQEHSETQKGLNSYFGNIDFSDPAQVIAAQSLFRMKNQGLAAEMIIENQKQTAFQSLLDRGETPSFNFTRSVKAGKDAVPRDRFFGRSESNKQQLADATKNAYSSSLGLATIQATAALQDKYAGVNTARQKEALRDLVEARSLAEKLLKDSKKKPNTEQNSQYYNESIKMLNTWIQALQR